MRESLTLTNGLILWLDELDIQPIRAQGSGGQNVNKVSSAIHLRFDIPRSSLPEFCKEQLLALRDQRLSKDGVLVIKAQQFRTQEQNRQEAIERLAALIEQACHRSKPRLATRPTKASKRRRLDGKNQRGQLKQLRKKPVL